MGCFPSGWFPSKNVGMFHSQENMGQAAVGRGIKSGAARNGRQLANRVSPYKEQLELLRDVRDLQSDGSLIRQAFHCRKVGRPVGIPSHDKLRVWARVQVRECYS